MDQYTLIPLISSHITTSHR